MREVYRARAGPAEGAGWYDARMQKPVVNVMVKAARQAGTVLLRHMGKLESLSVFEKGRQDYASEVDSLAEAEIIRELKRAYPDAAFLAEESGAMGKGRHTFVIDPLDGTSNYLRGIPHFCISIALVENGEPTDGVIFDPLRNELFTASKGALADAEDFRRTGAAALDLAYVAAGRVDAYFAAGVKAWDIAAGILLVREAGGRVCDFRGRGEKLLDVGQIVAGNLKISDALQKSIVQSGYANAFN